LLIAADPDYTPKIVAALTQAEIRASVIGRVQPAEKGRWLIGKNAPHPLPIFTRDEITRLFE
jgi:hypothetical protein